MTTPDQGMPQEAPPSPGQSGSNGLAIAGLIIAIVSLPAAIIGFVGPAIAILALVLSIIGMKRAGERGGAGKGLAIGGIVVAVIGILIGGAVTTCQVACTSQMNKAAQSGGFNSFGDMVRAAADMPKQLDKAAQEAGYKNYAEWQQKDPKAARAEMQKLSKKFGVKVKQDGEKMQGTGGTGGTTGGSAPSGGAPSGGGGTGN